jgi:hypothetical protein
MKRIPRRIRKMKTKKNLFRWGVIGVALITFAGNVQGSIRPYGSAGSLAELQTDVFYAIGATSIDVVSDQIAEMAFEPTSPNVSSEYVATVSWSASDVDFGIYNLADASQKLTLFNYPAGSSGDTTLLQFNLLGGYVRSVDGQSLSVIDSTSFFGQFGFYATSVYGTYYSEDDLNTGGIAHFLSYAGEGDVVTIGGHQPLNDIGHYYIASEFTPGGPSSDFTDMVVQLESILPIPEPATLGLLGLISGGIYFSRRFFTA